jgi:hypothetical protein
MLGGYKNLVVSVRVVNPPDPRIQIKFSISMIRLKTKVI